MKHIILFFVLLLPFSLAAQKRLEKSEKHIGTSHGVSASIVGFNPKIEQDYLLNYNGGIVYRYIADTNVGMQVELNFAQQGWHETNDFSRRLSYVELPFLTHIYIGDRTRFIINIGPQIGYLVAEQKTNRLQSADTEHTHQQTQAIQNDFDYGFAAGLGLSFSAGKNVFQLETRAYYALGDIYSNAKYDYFSRSNNMKLSVNLAWMIRVK